MLSVRTYRTFLLLFLLLPISFFVRCADISQVEIDFEPLVDPEDILKKPIRVEREEFPALEEQQLSQEVEEIAGKPQKTPPDIMQLLLGIVPLPDPVKNFFSGITVTYVKTDNVPSGFRNGSTIVVEAMVYGTVVQAYFIKGTNQQGKKGTSFIMTLPKKWKVSDMIPGFKTFDGVSFTQPTFIVSDFAYHDEERSIKIEPGFNVVASVDMDALHVPSAFNAVLDALKSKIRDVQVHGIIRKQLETSTFGLHIAPEAIADQRFSVRDFLTIAQLPMPRQALSVFENIALVDSDFDLYVDQYGYDLVIKGAVDIYGSRTDAELELYFDSKTNQSMRTLMVKLPPDWHFKEHFPALADAFDIKFNNGLFILSDHPYQDDDHDLVIEEGLNFVADIDFSQLKLPSFFSKVANLIGKAFNKMHVQGVIKSDIAQSTLLAYVPEDAMKRIPIRLIDFLPISKIPVPEKVEKVLRNIVLEFPRISFVMDPKKQQIFLSSSVAIYGRVIPVRLMLFNDEDNNFQTSFLMQLPKKWSLGSQFSEFQGKFGKDPRYPRFIISTTNYEDEELDIDIQKGLNFIGVIALDDLPVTPITKFLRKLSLVFKDLLVHITIPERIADSTIRFALMRTDNLVLDLNDIIDIDALTMPKSIRNVLKGMRLISPEISFILDPDIRTIIGIAELKIEAGAGYKGQTVRTRVLVRKKDAFGDDGNPSPLIPNISFELELPFDWDFNDDFDDADYLDTFSIDNPRFIVSNFRYTHPNFEQIVVSRGLNFIAGVQLKGPLQAVHLFVDKVLDKVVRIDADGAFTFTGTIGASLFDSSFSVHIPVRMEIDFDQLYAKKAWPFKMPLIQKISTDAFSATIEGRQGITRLGPAALELETGMRLYTRTQSEPLILRSGVSVGAAESSVYGFMDTPYDPAFGVKWLALNEFGVEVVFDYNILQTAMATTGTPAPSGLGVRGAMALGGGDSRTILELASKVSVSSVGLPSLILYGKAENVNLNHLVWLLAKIAGKNIKLVDLPALEFEKVDVRIVPDDTTLAHKKYSAGMYGSAWINIFGLYGGVDFSVNKWGITGRGILPKIDTPWFKLSAINKHKKASLDQLSEMIAEKEKQEAEQPVGIDDFPPLEAPITPTASLEKEKPHDGPSLQLDITLLAQRALVNGRAELPFLKISKDIEADISLSGIKFKMTDNLFGLFQTEFQVSVTKEDAFVKGRMQQSALDEVAKLLRNASNAMVKQANKDLNNAKRQVTKAMGDLDALKARVERSKNQCVH